MLEGVVVYADGVEDVLRRYVGVVGAVGPRDRGMRAVRHGCGGHLGDSSVRGGAVLGGVEFGL